MVRLLSDKIKNNEPDHHLPKKSSIIIRAPLCTYVYHATSSTDENYILKSITKSLRNQNYKIMVNSNVFLFISIVRNTESDANNEMAVFEIYIHSYAKLSQSHT